MNNAFTRARRRSASVLVAGVKPRSTSNAPMSSGTGVPSRVSWAATPAS